MRRVIIAAVVFMLTATVAQSQGANPPKPVPPRPDTTTPPRPRAAWTSDRPDVSVGDIITILIDERTLATAALTDNQADQRSKDMGLSVQTPPTGGVPAVPISAAMGFDNNGNSRQSGQTARQNSFQSQMSASVVAVSPTGMIQLKGRKLVLVDKSKQEVEITGWIRPQDISSANHTVPSYRMADAEIKYVQQGQLGKPKGGIISRVLGAIWP